jgi:hypothetical protein
MSQAPLPCSAATAIPRNLGLPTAAFSKTAPHFTHSVYDDAKTLLWLDCSDHGGIGGRRPIEVGRQPRDCNSCPN